MPCSEAEILLIQQELFAEDVEYDLHKLRQMDEAGVRAFFEKAGQKDSSVAKHDWLKAFDVTDEPMLAAPVEEEEEADDEEGCHHVAEGLISLVDPGEVTGFVKFSVSRDLFWFGWSG